MDKKLLVAICGDLWFAENLDRINELEPDLILWPLYIDYSIKEWKNEARDEYTKRISRLNAPVLMVNSFLQESKGAVGGAYLFDGGAIKDSLPLGEIGSLTITIE
jgi:N-carbamoylputrescine amidase